MLTRNTNRGTRTLLLEAKLTTIGTDGCNLTLRDDSLADAQHAVIEYMSSRKEYIIKDLNSRRGTFLNGLRLDESWVLQNGDRVQFANSPLYVFEALKSITVPGTESNSSIGSVDRDELSSEQDTMEQLPYAQRPSTSYRRTVNFGDVGHANGVEKPNRTHVGATRSILLNRRRASTAATRNVILNGNSSSTSQYNGESEHIIPLQGSRPTSSSHNQTSVALLAQLQSRVGLLEEMIATTKSGLNQTSPSPKPMPPLDLTTATSPPTSTEKPSSIDSQYSARNTGNSNALLERVIKLQTENARKQAEIETLIKARDDHSTCAEKLLEIQVKCDAYAKQIQQLTEEMSSTECKVDVELNELRAKQAAMDAVCLATDQYLASMVQRLQGGRCTTITQGLDATIEVLSSIKTDRPPDSLVDMAVKIITDLNPSNKERVLSTISEMTSENTASIYRNHAELAQKVLPYLAVTKGLIQLAIQCSEFNYRCEDTDDCKSQEDFDKILREMLPLDAQPGELGEGEPQIRPILNTITTCLERIIPVPESHLPPVDELIELRQKTREQQLLIEELKETLLDREEELNTKEDEDGDKRRDNHVKGELLDSSLPEGFHLELLFADIDKLTTEYDLDELKESLAVRINTILNVKNQQIDLLRQQIADRHSRTLDLDLGNGVDEDEIATTSVSNAINEVMTRVRFEEEEADENAHSPASSISGDQTNRTSSSQTNRSETSSVGSSRTRIVNEETGEDVDIELVQVQTSPKLQIRRKMKTHGPGHLFQNLSKAVTFDLPI